MNSVYSWIYVDYTYNIWKFSQNDNKELRYSIMYDEGKWTKESLIDNDVSGFTIFVEEEVIHIVYSTMKKEIKYCTMKDKQWVGKVLYQTEGQNVEIHNLKIEIIEDEMHIFYLLIDKDSIDHGVLMHCVWNGKETKLTTIWDIVISKIKEEYIVVVDNNNDIDVIFITDEGAEISINYSSFQNSKWTQAKRLYGIKGDDICFEVQKNQQHTHILNKSRENSIYYLDHVRVDLSGKIKEFKIYKSSVELSEPLLFISNNVLHSCWLEENKIFYSVFDGEAWGEPIYFNRGNEYAVERYGFYNSKDEKRLCRDRAVYGTGKLDLSLFIPRDFVIEEKDSFPVQSDEDIIKQMDIEEPQKKHTLQNVKLELSRVKSENKNLEKTIASLSMQVKKKQRFMEEYEERITKTLYQKQKIEENCHIFMEVQQKLQQELEKINNQLLEEIKLKEVLEKKLIDLEEENNIIRQQLQQIAEENTIMKQQTETIAEEKKNLNKELEFEKNQSFMERLLKGKVSGV